MEELNPGDALRERLAAMDPKKVKAYRRHRTVSATNPLTKNYFEYDTFRNGLPFWPSAPTASTFRYRDKPKEELGWGDTIKWSEDGFELVARIDDDDSSDSADYLGKIYDGDDKRRPADARPMEFKKRRDEYLPVSYFLSAYDPDDDFKRYRFSYSRRYARFHAEHNLRWSYERLKSMGQDWSMVGVIVTAYKDGIELGDASLWGIESDSPEYTAETAHEIAGEAIREAKGKLAELTVTQAEKDGKVLKTYAVKEVNHRMWVNRHRYGRSRTEEMFCFQSNITYHVTETAEQVVGRPGGPEIVRIVIIALPSDQRPKVTIADIARPDFDKFIAAVINKKETS